jgi:phenylpyruvate tautomerase PptA (4-oxalocrotonate tautomerase family)
MPFVRLDTNQRIPEEKRASLCATLSRICAETLGKPERYVISVVQDQATILQGGLPGPAAFVEVRSIGGLSPPVNEALTQAICRLLAETLSIPGTRVNVNLIDMPATHWGVDGSTFG